jgi:Domain of Unknown Function with PDB structure (DUF3857)/Domain of Unknown Function with PDB structure (DUF3858)/Transglutaminase-like superfamily
MKCKNPIGILLCLLLLQIYLPAQDKSGITFGKITPKDFDLSKYVFDSSAAAVVIADIGKTSFEGNNKGDFTLLFKRSKRVKIINKNGFDIAKEEIMVYENGSNNIEELANLKATTYNLENGNVVETKLDGKAIFTDKVDKTHSLKKFTFPAVKEGSIIELEYTIKSDFYVHLRPWSFQGEYPCLWSEYEVNVPQFFHYVSLTRGDQSYFIKTVKTNPAFYSVRISRGTEQDDLYNLTTNLIVSRWVMKDVPALKIEKFTSTLINHLSRIEFQLHYIQYGDQAERHDYMGSWSIASEKLLKDEYFGVALDKDNHWMTAELSSIISDSKNNLDKIRKIYAFVRDNFTCTDHDGIYVDNPLKTVFKNRNGNVAEVNMLLVAMLRHENIDADPVILSTRDNGFTDEVYPLIRQFNYVICVARDEDKTYCLDASLPRLGFDCLSEACYNGSARIINKDKPFIIRLDTDSLIEPKFTSVLIINDEKNQWGGSYQSTLGKFASFSLRDRINKEGEKEYFKELQTSIGSDMELENTGLDSLKKLEDPVKIHFEFNIKPLEGADRFYFNPMLSEFERENPFKAAERKYPVEMNYKLDETYVLSMEIPHGYEVEEIPKSARVLFNEKEGLFEYLIQKDESGIQLRTRIKLNRTVFQPEDYNSLRDFYGYIVKKQSEQIVFKKKQ